MMPRTSDAPAIVADAHSTPCHATAATRPGRRLTSAHPFTRLTPQAVLDALDDVGLRGDGRLLQLNSYENRVFQVMLEDGGAVVAKFYRPGRWSDAQIEEEHSFGAELAAAEVPVVPPPYSCWCLLNYLYSYCFR